MFRTSERFFLIVAAEHSYTQALTTCELLAMYSSLKQFYDCLLIVTSDDYGCTDALEMLHGVCVHI